MRIYFLVVLFPEAYEGLRIKFTFQKARKNNHQEKKKKEKTPLFLKHHKASHSYTGSGVLLKTKQQVILIYVFHFVFLIQDLLPKVYARQKAACRWKKYILFDSAGNLTKS